MSSAAQRAFHACTSLTRLDMGYTDMRFFKKMLMPVTVTHYISQCPSIPKGDPRQHQLAVPWRPRYSPSSLTYLDLSLPHMMERGISHLNTPLLPTYHPHIRALRLARHRVTQYAIESMCRDPHVRPRPSQTLGELELIDLTGISDFNPYDPTLPEPTEFMQILQQANPRLTVII